MIINSMLSKLPVISILRPSSYPLFATSVGKFSSSIGKGPDMPTFQEEVGGGQDSNAKQFLFPSSVYDKRSFKIDHQGLPLLKPKDCARRVEFATNVLRMDQDKTFLSSIIFSDEGNFRVFKAPGSQKKGYRRFNESKQLPVIVWCGMTSRHIIGPFFFNSYVTENSYLRMVKSYLLPKLKELGYQLETTWFQQDGAPPHRSKKVLKYLQLKFGPRLISYGCPIFWPAKSQDLTPLDYWLWDHIKEKVEKNYRPTNTADMRECITLELENIDQDVLEAVIFDFRNRLQNCIQAQGNRFES